MWLAVSSELKACICALHYKDREVGLYWLFMTAVCSGKNWYGWNFNLHCKELNANQVPHGILGFQKKPKECWVEDIRNVAYVFLKVSLGCQHMPSSSHETFNGDKRVTCGANGFSLMPSHARLHKLIRIGNYDLFNCFITSGTDWGTINVFFSDVLIRGKAHLWRWYPLKDLYKNYATTYKTIVEQREIMSIACMDSTGLKQLRRVLTNNSLRFLCSYHAGSALWKMKTNCSLDQRNRYFRKICQMHLSSAMTSCDCDVWMTRRHHYDDCHWNNCTLFCLKSRIVLASVVV